MAYDRKRKLRYLGEAAVAAIFMSQAGAVVAQDIVRDQPSDREIIVTGTRIRGQAPVGSPIISVGSDAIRQSSAISTSQLIQEIPQVMDLGVSENSRGQSGGAQNITYGTSINIRGLGPYSTLTLVDSHRVVPQGTSGQAVDASIIPSNALARIDILADGASALYGSDAVAGVANLVLRRRTDAKELNVRYGRGADYSESQINGFFGTTGSWGGVTFAFEHAYRSDLSGLDRDFFQADLTSRGGGDYRVTQCAPGNIVAGGVSYAIPQGGVTAANAGALVPNTVNKCTNISAASLLPEQVRDSAVMTFDLDPADGLKISGDILYSRRTFSRDRPYAATNLTVPNNNPYFVLPRGAATSACPASVGAPAGARCVTVQYSSADDFPQETNDGFSEVYSGTIGATYELPSDWSIGGNFTIGRTRESSKTRNAQLASALTAALASSNVATAFNPFGSGNRPDVIANILTANIDNRGVVDFKGWQAKLDGPLFDLPAGTVRLALGYEGQRLRANTINIGGTFAAPTRTDTINKRAVDSGYAELLVPLASPEMNLPWLYRADLNLAFRYDHYDDFGSTTNPKFGINISPTRSLTFRGSYGTSFRAPTLNQRGTGLASGALRIQNYGDPTCGCVRQGVTLSGPNANLDPEEATTWSLGVNWRPQFIPGLDLDVNYFNVRYDGQITSYLSDLTILGREAQFVGSGVITRNPDPALIASLVEQTGSTIVLPNPVTLLVDARQRNLGVTVASGFDLQATYRTQEGPWGRFTINALASIFTKYKLGITAASPLLDVVNTIYNPFRFKGRFGVRWNKGPWRANASLNYINSYDNVFLTPAQKVKSYTVVDTRLGVDLGKIFGDNRTIELALDIRNLFDRKPPFVDIAQSQNGGGGFDPSSANPVGRVVGVVLGVNF